MKRMLWPLLAALAGGCTAYNDVSLVILDTEAVTPMNHCVVPGMPTMSQSEGTFDVGVVELGFGGGFFIAPVVKNNLLERASPTVPERDGISVIGYDVVLHPPNAFPLSNASFTTLISGPYLLPGESGGTSFTAIDVTTAKQIAGTLTVGSTADIDVQFRAKGRRADGEIDSGWSNFPVHVCNGCLTGAIQNPCPPLMMTQVSMGGCNLAQDAAVTCCFANNVPVCGTAVPTVMGGP
jgi:hypothetical protein